MTCKKCGGAMINEPGIVIHCEYALDHTYETLAPDDGPVYCSYISRQWSTTPKEEDA